MQFFIPIIRQNRLNIQMYITCPQSILLFVCIHMRYFQYFLFVWLFPYLYSLKLYNKGSLSARCFSLLMYVYTIAVFQADIC